MSKAQDERLYYLQRFYGRGGWHAPRNVDVAKKYQTMLDHLLKNGLLEKDLDYDLYRITDRGVSAISIARKAHQ